MISLLVMLIIFGIIAWAIGQIPVAQPFRAVIYAVMLIILVVYLANFFGYGPHWNFPKD